MTEITRTYTIPLRRKYANTPRHKRTHKAVRVLREFLVQHMKSEDVKIGKHLNEHLWQNGIRNPPSKVTVVATKDKDNSVKVELEGKQYVDFKVKEVTNKDQTFKEKLQSKVAAAKGSSDKEETPAKEESSDKEEKSSEKKDDSKQEEKPSSKKSSTKKTTKKAAPAKEESSKKEE